MNVKNKLNRYKSLITNKDDKTVNQHFDGDHSSLRDELADNGSEQSPFVNCQQKSAPNRTIPFQDEWEAFHTKPFYFDNHYSLIREVSYPVDYLHGRHRFSELSEVIQEWEMAGLEHPLSFANKPSLNMVFFDTETTGLGGGVGNTIFLIGYAQVYADHVIVKQHFLPNPSGEVALYQGFLTDLGDLDAMKLTTYNGKAFDWPQIKTRHTLIRDAVPKLPAFGHFDLLHAARRLWKHRLPSVRLSIVEQEVLNVFRDSDVPGYLAPLLYFDFLKDKNPSGLKGVFTHNEIDVLSLITLYIHISKKLLNVPAVKKSDEEKYEIARWFEAVGQFHYALHLYEEVARTNERFSKQAQFALACLYKKNNQYEQAIGVLTNLVNYRSAFEVDSALELSKLYEHQYKDYEKALFYAQKSFDTWKNNKKVIRNGTSQEKTSFLKRIDRLERKLKS